MMSEHNLTMWRRQLAQRAAEIMYLLGELSDIEVRAAELRKSLTAEYEQVDEALDGEPKKKGGQ